MAAALPVTISFIPRQDQFDRSWFPPDGLISGNAAMPQPRPYQMWASSATRSTLHPNLNSQQGPANLFPSIRQPQPHQPWFELSSPTPFQLPAATPRRAPLCRPSAHLSRPTQQSPQPSGSASANCIYDKRLLQLTPRQRIPLLSAV